MVQKALDPHQVVPRKAAADADALTGLAQLLNDLQQLHSMPIMPLLQKERQHRSRGVRIRPFSQAGHAHMPVGYAL